MGSKLLWTGLTLLIALPVFMTGYAHEIKIVGAASMILGTVIVWFK